MRLSLILLTLLPITPAVAQDITGATRVYSNILAFPMPQGFAPAYEDEQNGDYILEFVPQDQDIDAWEELVTLTGAEGVAQSGASALDYVQTIGAGFQEACPDTFIAWDEGAQTIEGARDAHLIVVACGSLEGASETVAILGVMGDADAYSFQWAARGPAQKTKPQMDVDFWKPRAEMLVQLRLCPVVEGEEPPYPSCTG